MGGIADVGDRIIASVKAYVAGATEEIDARLNEIDARIKAIRVPKDGDPGKDADPALIQSAVEKEFESMAIVFIKGLQDG